MTLHRRTRDQPPGNRGFTSRVTQPVRAVGMAATFFLKVFPMLPSRPVDWVTKTPLIEQVRYPTCCGEAEGDLYRPPGEGPYPGIVVCLGVVPFGVDHPQVPVLGKALARAGFAALLYWSPAMRDFCLDPDDIENIALAYDWLVGQSFVDPARSGLLGTCVGGSFALMAAASPLIRDRVAFLSAYAPFSSMETFVQNIAGATRAYQDEHEPWQVDPLTHKVFLYSLTAWLEAGESEQLRRVCAEEDGDLDARALSADGQAIYALLSASKENQAAIAMQRLPRGMRDRLAVMSPLNYLDNVRAPLIILLHDRGDLVIPVGESRRLQSALAGRSGVHYTEMEFQHLDPVKRKLPLLRLVRELSKFLVAVYPMFRQAVA